MTTRHGVVVVHGQGNGQVRGAQLAEFANPVVELLNDAGNEARLHFDGDAETPSARIEVRRRAGREADDEDHHIFELREGFWGDAFPAPSAEQVTHWALGGLGSQMDGIRTGWWLNPTAAPSADERAQQSEHAFGRRASLTVYPEAPLVAWPYRLTLVALTALFTIMSVLTFLVLRPLAWFAYSLAGTPGVRMFGLTANIADAIAGLNPFLSRVLGDTERFVVDNGWAVNVRARIERILFDFLDDGVDDIVIVAYSAGAGVVYDVLLEHRRLAERLDAMIADGRRPPPIRLLTVGSGIFHMWSFAGMASTVDRDRRHVFTGSIAAAIRDRSRSPRPFPFWTDLFARFDFVAAGPIRDEIARRSGLVANTDYRSHRVINYDHVADDHFGYFRNRQLAVPRMIAVLFGDERWMREMSAEEAKRGAFTRIDPVSRSISVFWLNMAKLLPLLVLVAHAVALLAWAGYRGFCVTVADAIVPGWADALWARIAEEIGVRSQFVVIGFILFLFFSVLGRALYGWWRPKVDDGDRLGLLRGLRAIRGVGGAVGDSVKTNAIGYVLLVAILLALGSAGLWFYVPAQIRAGALTLQSGPFGLDLHIVDATASEVALTGAAKHTEHPGVLGLQWADGYGQVGDVLREVDGRVVRRFAPLAPSPDEARSGAPPLGPARVDTGAFTGDPMTAHGIPFTDVEFEAPLGPQRAWVAGSGHTWAIVTHGKGATRQESLRIMPTLIDLGMTVMTITYRNDRESIQDPTGEYEYGATEWRDLEAAVDYALSHGASDVVLYGYSMGGAITASFLERSDRASHVRAVVLDAPMLDFAPTVELGISGTPIAGRFAHQLRVMTGIRLRIDWADLDYLDEDVAKLQAPILLFHGDADDVVPVETSRRLARLRGDIVEYHEFPDAGHTREWNVDPAGYERLVREFLDAQLAR